MSGFTVPVQLIKANPLSDGGMSVGFHTKELNDEEKLQIMKYFNGAGWLLFRENEIKEGEVPEQDAEFETKTPSQRLRAVLFVMWKQQGEKEDFEVYYKTMMNKLIEHLKTKLAQ